jgi:hypothetical protein
VFQILQRNKKLLAEMTTPLEGLKAEESYRNAVVGSGLTLTSPILITVQLGLEPEAKETHLAAYVARQ